MMQREVQWALVVDGLSICLLETMSIDDMTVGGKMRVVNETMETTRR